MECDAILADEKCERVSVRHQQKGDHFGFPNAI